MQQTKTMKFILISFLAVSLIFGGPALAASQAGESDPLAVSAEQGVADQKNQSGSSTLLSASDGKVDVPKAYSINEINRYLSQMDAADLADTLKLFRVIQLVKSKYVADISTDTLMAGAVKGAVNAAGDPYSLYMDPKMYKDLMVATKGSFGGVGLVLGIKENILTVVAPIEGTPAEQAGIVSGDQVVKIDGQDTKEMALDEAVNRIRGPEGSQVTLTIFHPGQEAKEYVLERATIPIRSVGGKMLENNIGYIRISMFNENTGDNFAQKMQELAGQGMKAVILDLRSNPGGLLEESVKVAGHFVPQGPIVSVIMRDGTKETRYSSLSVPQYPLVVLVDGGSASASEIVAGAVQDTGAGMLIGTKTFGKGSVQNLFPLGDASAIKLTTAKYYTPKGRSIHGIGIEPDIKVEMPDYKQTAKDLQLETALEVLKEKLQ